jgi:hypothetical protein
MPQEEFDRHKAALASTHHTCKSNNIINKIKNLIVPYLLPQAMPQEEFDCHKAALASNKLQKDTALAQEADRVWEQVGHFCNPSLLYTYFS